MSDTRWKWQEHCLEAFLETNSLKLAGRIAAAEKAVFLRTKELRGNLGGPAERQAIADALNGLSVLKREINTPIGIKANKDPSFGNASSLR